MVAISSQRLRKAWPRYFAFPPWLSARLVRVDRIARKVNAVKKIWRIEKVKRDCTKCERKRNLLTDFREDWPS